MEDRLKETLLLEYKELVAKDSEAKGILGYVGPRIEAIAKLLITYGWDKEIEKLEIDDDMANNPAEAKTKSKKIEDLLKGFFSTNNNQWTRLSDLFVFLSSKGMRLGGKNPNSTLSAHLSNSECFESDRTRGWRLKPEFVVADAPAQQFERRV
jgi:hypothetical protein